MYVCMYAYYVHIVDVVVECVHNKQIFVFNGLSAYFLIVCGDERFMDARLSQHLPSDPMLGGPLWILLPFDRFLKSAKAILGPSQIEADAHIH